MGQVGKLAFSAVQSAHWVVWAWVIACTLVVLE